MLAMSKFRVNEQGVRLAIGVSLAVFLGYSVHQHHQKSQGLNPNTIPKDWVTNISSCLQLFCLWWAMTMVQISGDEIGGVMRDALRRLIAAAVGSIIGTGTVLLYRLHPPYPCVLVATIAGAVMS
eukprot:TRINITY_DN47146_c0_g1_i1.p3 TRINITY_DN47146_c0_g1~~TRINITY_DN47146_c0_g1_i1.p3  ORF type:complete len:125 (-),score=2.47 TRINITY_DN47146_c0_g1_i1:45-419(-)